jgi:hypothetical protein
MNRPVIGLDHMKLYIPLGLGALVLTTSAILGSACSSSSDSQASGAGGKGTTASGTGGAGSPSSSSASSTGAGASTSSSTSTGTGGSPASVVIAAAGDIAGGQEAKTSALLEKLIPADGINAVLTLGDNAYPNGSQSDFQNKYGPTWGVPAILGLTHPAPGNHDYQTKNATGYFGFFNGGAQTGPAGKTGEGWYSYDLGAWHLIALNSSNECSPVDCGTGSAQYAWLKADLAAHPNKCVLAYWHHPRFQVGATHGDSAAVSALWDLLYDSGADVVLQGHEHNFQQLAPMDKAGKADANGLRSFVVGTGGAGFYTTFNNAHPVEAKFADAYGVLELTLQADNYAWKFYDDASMVRASGSAKCR